MTARSCLQKEAAKLRRCVTTSNRISGEGLQVDSALQYTTRSFSSAANSSMPSSADDDAFSMPADTAKNSTSKKSQNADSSSKYGFNIRLGFEQHTSSASMRSNYSSQNTSSASMRSSYSNSNTFSASMRSSHSNISSGRSSYQSINASPASASSSSSSSVPTGVASALVPTSASVAAVRAAVAREAEAIRAIIREERNLDVIPEKTVIEALKTCNEKDIQNIFSERPLKALRGLRIALQQPMFLTPEVVEHICTNLNQLVATREFAVIQEAADELSSSDLCPLAQSWTGFAKTPRLSPTVRDVIGMAMANSAINMLEARRLAALPGYALSDLHLLKTVLRVRNIAGESLDAQYETAGSAVTHSMKRLDDAMREYINDCMKDFFQKRHKGMLDKKEGRDTLMFGGDPEHVSLVTVYTHRYLAEDFLRPLSAFRDVFAQVLTLDSSVRLLEYFASTSSKGEHSSISSKPSKAISSTSSQHSGVTSPSTGELERESSHGEEDKTDIANLVSQQANPIVQSRNFIFLAALDCALRPRRGLDDASISVATCIRMARAVSLADRLKLIDDAENTNPLLSVDMQRRVLSSTWETLRPVLPTLHPNDLVSIFQSYWRTLASTPLGGKKSPFSDSQMRTEMRSALLEALTAKMDELNLDARCRLLSALGRRESLLTALPPLERERFAGALRKRFREERGPSARTVAHVLSLPTADFEFVPLFAAAADFGLLEDLEHWFASGVMLRLSASNELLRQDPMALPLVLDVLDNLKARREAMGVELKEQKTGTPILDEALHGSSNLSDEGGEKHILSSRGKKEEKTKTCPYSIAFNSLLRVTLGALCDLPPKVTMDREWQLFHDKENPPIPKTHILKDLPALLQLTLSNRAKATWGAPSAWTSSLQKAVLITLATNTHGTGTLTPSYVWEVAIAATDVVDILDNTDVLGQDKDEIAGSEIMSELARSEEVARIARLWQMASNHLSKFASPHVPLFIEQLAAMTERMSKDDTSLITECRSAVFSGIESHCENDSWTSCNDYARVLDALARLQWFNESVISHLCNGILRLSGDTGIGLGKSVTNTNAISSTSTRNNTAAALTGGASWDDLGKLVTGFARMRVHHGDVLDSIHAALVGRLDGYRQDRQDRYAETHTNSSPPDVILRIVEGLSDIGALNTNRDIAQIFANIFDKWAMQLTNEISADAHSSISARANESPSWPELLKMGATLTCDRIFPRCLQVVLEPLVEEFKARGIAGPLLKPLTQQDMLQIYRIHMAGAINGPAWLRTWMGSNEALLSLLRSVPSVSWYDLQRNLAQTWRTTPLALEIEQTLREWRLWGALDYQRGFQGTGYVCEFVTTKTESQDAKKVAILVIPEADELRWRSPPHSRGPDEVNSVKPARGDCNLADSSNSAPTTLDERTRPELTLSDRDRYARNAQLQRVATVHAMGQFAPVLFWESDWKALDAREDLRREYLLQVLEGKFRVCEAQPMME